MDAPSLTSILSESPIKTTADYELEDRKQFTYKFVGLNVYVIEDFMNAWYTVGDF